MNRQTKRQMARQGSDRAARAREAVGAEPAGRAHRSEAVLLRGPRRDEEGGVAAAHRRSSTPRSIVLVGLVVMTALIFVFDWAAVHIVNFVFK